MGIFVDFVVVAAVSFAPVHSCVFSEEIRNHLMENCDEYKMKCVTTMYFYDYAPWGTILVFFSPNNLQWNLA